MIPLKWHPHQQQCFDFKTRFLIAVCGRTFGKTRGSMNWLLREIHTVRSPIGWYISLTYNQAKTAFRYLMRIIDETPELARIAGKPNKSDLVIPFSTGREIHFKTSDIPQNLRGENTLGGMVLDEAGWMSSDVWGTIRPNMSTYSCRCVFIGTPNSFNWYYNLWLDALENTEEYTIARYTSWDNTMIPKAEHDKAYDALVKTRGKDYADQEMKAEFKAASLCVFHNVDKCVTHDMPDYDPSARYTMGIDVAVRHDDTAIVVINNKTLAIHHIEIYNRSNVAEMGQGIFKAWQKFNHPVIYMDCTREEYFAEELETRYAHERFYIERVKFTVKNKNDIVTKAADLIGRGALKIPATELGKVLVNQLNIYERKTKTSGYESMGGKNSSKDDLVTALCLACMDITSPSVKDDTEKDEESTTHIPDRIMSGGY